tara:strand:- start:64 stop:288 length:225 start_codon:yes stop_codon:yes gene_type:complete
MSKELLLLEALCEKLGFDVEFEEGVVMPGGRGQKTGRYILETKREKAKRRRDEKCFEGFKPSPDLQQKGTWTRK